MRRSSASARKQFRDRAVSATCLLSVVAIGAQAFAEELPARKPGHWRLTTIADSIGMKTIETCIAPGDSIVLGIGDRTCGPPDVTRHGSELFVTLVCKTDAGTETRSTVLTGDFTSRYRAMSKVTFNPPQGGMPHMGATVDGKYIGPSCDDFHASAGRPSN